MSKQNTDISGQSSVRLQTALPRADVDVDRTTNCGQPLNNYLDQLDVTDYLLLSLFGSYSLDFQFKSHICINSKISSLKLFLKETNNRFNTKF